MHIKLLRIVLSFYFISQSLLSFAQSNPDDYWLNHPTSPFTSGQTIITNSGFFYDDGGDGPYGEDQNWNVRFCSENGNPITFDFNGFATHYVGPLPGESNYLNYDYIGIVYPGGNWVVYHDDTPQFSFTSPDGCMDFSFISQPSTPTHNGWIAAISALPPPPNNDPCTAAPLPVGNICSPSYFTNKGAYNTTNLGSPPCKTYFGGDVWFTAVVPPSGQLKVETFPGSLTYGIMVLYSGACNALTYINCIDINNSMPSAIYTGTPGTVITIRIFGEQAKSGTFGICATDPTAPITGFTGPGGVGDSISNKLWLKADKGVLNNSDNEATSGDGIRTWKDFSGIANDLVQSTLSSQASFTDNAMSTMPALQFDGDDDHYLIAMNPLSAPVSVFTVNRFMESNKDQTLLTLGDATPDNSFSISRENDERYYSLRGSKFYGPDISGDEARILHVSHKLVSPFHNLGINSQGQAVTDFALPLITNGALYLGTSLDFSGYLSGLVGEVIIYSKSLNTAQEIIVNNYLAAKYDINLGANSRYSYQASHRYDVAGIGRVDSDNIHTKAQSSGILAIGGADDLDNGEFLLFGHDNGDISAWAAEGVPDGDENLLRIERTWRVNITGGNGPGNVSVSISDSLLPPKEDGFLAFNILVSTDDDFISSATAYGVIKSGNEFIANDLSLNDGDYITIASVKPFVGFAADSSSGFENVPNPQIEVSLNYAISELLEVDYSVIEGTATGGGVDYNLNPGKLVFNPGEKTQFITPLIIDDDIVEIPDEYFIIGLSNPTAGVQIGINPTHVYTILNNDIGITISPENPVTGTCATSIDTLRATVSGTAPFNYSWIPTAGLSDPSAGITAVKPSLTTTYILTVTDGNGFTGVDSVTVTVEPLPAKPVIDPAGTHSITYGDSVLLTATAATGYLWSTGDTVQSIYVNTGGEYFLKVFDVYGCESEGSDTTVVSIGSRSITVTADSDQGKVYGSSEPELTYTITSGSLVEGDSFTGNLIRESGETAGTYVIQLGTLSAGSGYDITYIPADFTISPRELTLANIAANDKVYDGNTAATLNYSGYTLNGILGGETVVLDFSSYLADFESKDVGINIPVSVTGLALSGADAGNYILIQPVGLTADITAKALTVSGILANDKEYDGTAVATLTTAGYSILGVVGAESVGIDEASYAASFDSKDIGTGKPVTVTSMELTGADAGNYTLILPVGLMADISAKTLTINGVTAIDKEYDGTVTAFLSTAGYSLTGVIGTEEVGLNVDSYNASFDTKDVGENKPVTVTGLTLSGADAGNYTLTMPVGLTADITAKALSVSGIMAIDKEYDGTVIASLNFTGYALPGIIGIETVSLDEASYTASFDTKNVGVDKPVTVTGLTLNGADAGNYILIQPVGLTADITAKALTVSGILANDKEYDGTAVATLTTAGYTILGVVGAESVGIDEASYAANFDTKDIGTDKPVTVTSMDLTGADAGNYTLILPAGLMADISAKVLTVSGITAIDKEYDGTVTAFLSTAGYSLTGVIGTEEVNLNVDSYNASFDTKDVGDNKPVTVTGLTLSGPDAGNYTLTMPVGLTADITTIALSVTGIMAIDKEYDGTVIANLNFNEYAFSGIIGTDTVSLDQALYAASFDTKNVGVDKPVTVTGLTLTGDDAGNYIITLPVGLTADITAKAITVSGILANDKEYDGTTVAFITTSAYTLSGIIGSDTVSLNESSYTASFETKDVGVDKNVTISTLNLQGADAGNYTPLSPAGLMADITVRTLNISNFVASDKVYDGTTTVTGTGFDDDRIAGDMLEFGFIAAFEDANIGMDKTVNYTNISITGGADKDNYLLASTTGTALASIFEDIPEKPVISALGPVSFCAGGNVVLSSSEAYSYVWSTGETTRTITVQQSGTFYVVAKTEAGNESQPSDNVIVTVFANPELTISKTDVSCFGGSDGSASASVSIGASPYNYSWSNGGNTSIIQNLSAGTYTLALTDANSCSGTAQVTIIQPAQIVIQETVTPAYCPDGNDGQISISVTGGISPYLYDWSTGMTGSFQSNLTHGNYSVTVTDANNCQAMKNIILPYTNELCFRIPDIITPNDDGWNDEWVIDGLQFYPGVSVEIYNRWGKRVFYSKGYDTPWDGTFEGMELPMDSYHYIINLNNGTAPIIGNITIVR